MEKSEIDDVIVKLGALGGFKVTMLREELKAEPGTQDATQINNRVSYLLKKKKWLKTNATAGRNRVYSLTVAGKKELGRNGGRKARAIRRDAERDSAKPIGVLRDLPKIAATTNSIQNLKTQMDRVEQLVLEIHRGLFGGGSAS